MTQPTITQIGRYKILGVIGQGGMGIVYRALDPNMAREVAIKMPHGDKELLEHFQREVRATASFQHKNIVTVHTVDDFEGFPYMVMEYLDGQSVAEAISSGRVLNLADKLSLIMQVCDGLQYAHDLGVIHRDIKPANIYILKDRLKDRDLTAKILDFGIARIDMDSSITRTGEVRGSVSYMSPEQITGRKLDGRTDVYSTGVMLFQLLTGEIPYKSNDPGAAFSKILNDPIPSLSGYIKDYPASLDGIVARAMAKNIEERYQSAEEFGYDLSQLLETVKRGMTQEYLEQAKAAALRKDLDQARQYLLEILKLDRHHAKANELLQAVRQELQKQQRFLQIQQLRSQAQVALAGSHYEEALECMEQACQISPEDRELADFRETIKETAKRAKTLEDALRRGQAALYVGDLKEAEAAVNEALQCEQNHTEARALKELIQREVEERSRRQQVQVFVEKARQEISKSQFLAALEALQKAREIDPTDSNISELLQWASRGHQQEKRRNELDAITKQVSLLLAGEDYKAASQACDAALQTYPEEPSLIKLKQLADRQSGQAEKRRFVEEQSARARHLSDAGSYEEAIAVLEQAIQRHPDEESLTALLGMTRNELEFRQREKLESERIHEQLNSSKLAGSQQDRSLEEMRLIEDGIRKASTSAEVAVFVERSGFLARQHATQPAVQSTYQDILAIATKFREAMDASFQEISSLDETMQANQDVSQLEGIHHRIQGIQMEWPEERQFRNVLDRASDRLSSANEAKNAIQAELDHLGQSIVSAHSLTQISLYLQQAGILSTEWSSDKDIAQHLKVLQQDARTVTDKVEAACVQIKAMTATLLNAPTLEESERQFAAAQAVAQPLGSFDEVRELLEKANRRLSERKIDYQRIERGIRSLISSTANVRGAAELELILARRRDLLGKYPEDNHLAAAVADLEAALTTRRTELAAQAAIEEAEELEASTSSMDVAEPTLLIPARPDTVSSKSTGTTRGISVPPTPARKFNPLLLAAAGLLVVAGAVAFFIYPRAIEVSATPTDASILIDGASCAQPCVAHLGPGAHDVNATQNGYVKFHQSFNVSLMNNERWNIAMSPLAPASVQPFPASAPVAANSNDAGSISIQTVPAVAEAEVFLDNSPITLTDSAGKAVLPVTPGSHAVRISKLSYLPVPAKNVTVSQGKSASLRFQFEKDPSFNANSAKLPPPPVQAAAPVAPVNPPSTAPAAVPVDTFIVLQAPAGAEIHIDQQFAGHSLGSVIKSKVQPGQRTVEVFLAGFQPWSQTVTVAPGKDVNLVAKMVPLPTPVAPSTPTTHATAGISDQDRKQVQQVLDLYQAGFNQRDIRLLQKSYPKMPKDLAESYKQFFKNKGISMKLQITSMDLVGSQIKVEGRQSLRYQDDDGKLQQPAPAKVTFLLTNPGGQWIIAAIPIS